MIQMKLSIDSVCLIGTDFSPIGQSWSSTIFYLYDFDVLTLVIGGKAL